MVFVVYVAPNYTENALRFIEKLAALPDARLGLISQEPIEWLSPALQSRIVSFQRVESVFDIAQLLPAAKGLKERQGAIHRIIGAVEQVQMPVAQVREELGIEGMDVETMLNFRDKSRMKDLLRTAGLPCAKHSLAADVAEALHFAEEVGLPLVVKPPDGAAAQSTFKVNSIDELAAVLSQGPPSPEKPLLLEEFITGTEHSFDAYSRNGQHLFYTISNYYPTPLEVLQEPWIQWQVVLPREVEAPEYDDIRAAAFRTLDVLGMQTAMSHMEWFRRKDGSIAISEVAARPPGAQFTTLISRANDFDSITAWARLMIFGEFTPPTRQYAAGAAYLRAQGQGKVISVSGLDAVNREIGHLFTDVKIPKIGQDKAPTYEGEGFIILRHPDTAVVKEALELIVSKVQVRLG
ncbi:MAG: ATP-grasp domain-containing protein [Saprospiraceae bacterium]|nr:ATP-grasp domain-containing protein [Saprospiraceae bacterium]